MVAVRELAQERGGLAVIAVGRDVARHRRCQRREAGEIEARRRLVPALHIDEAPLRR